MCHAFVYSYNSCLFPFWHCHPYFTLQFMQLLVYYNTNMPSTTPSTIQGPPGLWKHGTLVEVVLSIHWCTCLPLAFAWSREFVVVVLCTCKVMDVLLLSKCSHTSNRHGPGFDQVAQCPSPWSDAKISSSEKRASNKCIASASAVRAAFSARWIFDLSTWTSTWWVESLWFPR